MLPDIRLISSFYGAHDWLKHLDVWGTYISAALWLQIQVDVLTYVATMMQLPWTAYSYCF